MSHETRIVTCRRTPVLAGLVLVLGLAGTPAAWSQTVIYVDARATGAGNGTSWADAFTKVQPALNAAQSGAQVWVAAGRYVERITLTNGVALYGGFAGTETELGQRNWVVNETILDGNQGGSVVTGPTGATETTRIDGFTITNGKATNGGGIYLYSSSPSVANNKVAANRATYGGGLYLHSSSATVVNNVIQSNIQSTQGGGLYLEGASAPTIATNKITGNRAASGGGLYLSGSSATIVSNEVCDNTGSAQGGGLYMAEVSSSVVADNVISNNSAVAGGGLYLKSSSLNIERNAITANTASSGGGGAYVDTSTATIARNKVCRNAASHGGGVYVYRSAPVIEGSVIIANNATSTGGGLYLQDSNATLSNNNIAANSAPSGGALAVSGSSPTITNNTIAGNGGQTGAGLSLLSCSPTIANTIVALNASGIYRTGTGTPTLAYNCVYGNTAYNYSGLTDPTGTNGNISVDPQFASAECGNWHIQPDSPCANAGDNNYAIGDLDIDGQPRVQPAGGAVDIGADESDGTIWPLGPYLVVRVSTDGDDQNDGASWTSPKRTVQAAIDTVSLLGGEVWVRAGTYYGQITLYPFAHVYGGFAGTETQRDQRNWTINVTVLDGLKQGSVVTAIQGHRVASIDGFTITNGVGTRVSSQRFGGGLYLSCSSPTVANNRSSGNSADNGGGLYLSGSCSTIANNTVTSSTAAYGGGLRITASSSPTIANNAITGNGARSGGGLSLDTSSGMLVNNTIVGNSATSGGGLSLANATPTIANTVIAHNSSGVCRDSGGTPILRHNCVYGNTLYNYSGLSDPTGVNGNLSVDPGLASTEYGNWHLQPDSPCVDAGDNSYVVGAFDLDRQPRIQPAGGTVDIGADEADGTTWPAGPYAVVRVSPDGDDQNDGSSWDAPKRTIAAALAAAAARGGEVWVRAGTYPECVTIPAHAFLYGGFAGTETQLQERNWNVNLTVLDGQQQGSVVTILAGYRTGTLDGFTITGGSGTEVAFSSGRYGGGLYLANCSPRIANNTILDNMALGAGIGYGGGAYLSYSLATIADNTIAENTASDGGGLYLYQSPAMIINNVVTENAGSGLHLSRSDALVEAIPKPGST